MKLFLIFLLFNSMLYSFNLDDKVKIVISSYDLKPKKIIEKNLNENDRLKIESGKILFETTILSGNRDNACVNCHLDKFNSTDGLPMAVGVKGKGEGIQRYEHGKGILVQRNALALTGRASKEFTSYFWDGRVQLEDGFIISKFGDKISKRFNSILSVAAIFPIMERDELIGTSSLFSPNSFSEAVGDEIYIDKYNILTKVLKNRIFEESSKESLILQKNLKKLNISKENFELADIGNLIASFIEFKFVLKESKFDKYLNGKIDILSNDEKEGLLLFFGKGRCYYCHNGNLYSDFKFHSIGTPQGYFGVNSRHRDIGRAQVTTKFKDFYKFRTPPLIDVKNTSPYGHNGSFSTLYEVLIHHINPFEFYIKNKDYYHSDYFKIGKLINSRDEVLNTIDINSDNEVKQIIKFLETL